MRKNERNEKRDYSYKKGSPKNNRKDKKTWTPKESRGHIQAGDEAADRQKDKPSVNHDYMWNADPNMFDMSTRIGFDFRLGDRIPFGENSIRIPGVVGINYIPTFGHLDNALSPANRAAQYLMTAMSTAVTGKHFNFDQTDVMGYYMAGDSISQAIIFIQRALLTIGNYSSVNRYYPEGILRGMGIIPLPTDKTNLASYVTRLDAVIRCFNSLYMPNVFTLIERHASMLNSIFMDENNTFAQSIIFRPAVLYKWTYTKTAKLRLQTLDWANTSKPIATYLDMLEGMMDALYGALDDILSLSGALLNTLGPGAKLNFSTFLPGTADFRVGADYKIMNYIHNAHFVIPCSATGGVDINNAFDIVYDQVVDEDQNVIKAYLTQKIYCTKDSFPAAFDESGSRLFDIHGDPTDKNLLMAATRGMIGAYERDASKITLTNFGTEILCGLTIYTYDDSGSLDTFEWSPILPISSEELDANYNAKQVWLTTNISHMPCAYYEGSTLTSTTSIPVWNTDFLTSIDTDRLVQINKTAMMSIFAVEKLNYIK